MESGISRGKQRATDAVYSITLKGSTFDHANEESACDAVQSITIHNMHF